MAGIRYAEEEQHLQESVTKACSILAHTYGLNADWLILEDTSVFAYGTTLEAYVLLRFKKYIDDITFWYESSISAPYPWTAESIVKEVGNCISISYEHTTNRINSLPAYGYKNGRHLDIERPNILHQICDISVDKHEKGNYAILTIRNNITNHTTDACFKYDAKTAEWVVTNPKQKIFMLMRLGKDSLSRLSFKYIEAYGHPEIDYETGIVTLPCTTNTAEMCEYDIISESCHKIVLIHYTANYIAGNKNRGPYVSKSCIEHTIYIDHNGKIQKISKKLSIPSWLTCINTSKDFVCNPHNEEAHVHLGSDVDPIYESDMLYVTSSNDFYIYLGGIWILSDKEWIEDNPSKIQEDLNTHIERYKLLVKLSA